MDVLYIMCSIGRRDRLIPCLMKRARGRHVRLCLYRANRMRIATLKWYVSRLLVLTLNVWLLLFMCLLICLDLMRTLMLARENVVLVTGKVLLLKSLLNGLLRTTRYGFSLVVVSLSTV